MGLKNTRTEENLRKALAGESIARSRYTYYAATARACGHEDVAAAFEEMAQNELVHARFWFEQLYGKPTDTRECLVESAQNENMEWSNMYPEFARQAREEGFENLAIMFEHVANIEQSHEHRLMALWARLVQMEKPAQQPAEQEEQMVREKKVGYRCQFCGAIRSERPDVCDVCKAIGAFEQVEYEVSPTRSPR